jgi:hypothetical protein
VHHREKLHEFLANMEKAVNEIGVQCMPYPGKNSTISKFVGWFDKEIQAMPSAIAKANNNFLCYYIAGVLRMLYESANCSHIEELQTIMNSCNASILDDIPDDLGKLSRRIVRKWWASHGLPYVTDLFRITPEVRMFFTCCDAWRLC